MEMMVVKPPYAVKTVPLDPVLQIKPEPNPNAMLVKIIWSPLVQIACQIVPRSAKRTNV